MTDLPPISPVPDEHDADLLASLYLDGEATAEEVAMVEGDARLMERVAELRGVAEQLARPITPPDGLARLHIDAALDAFSPTTADVRSTTPAPVADAAAAATPISLAERRARRRPRALPSWLGAAAATVVVLGGIGFGISQLSSSTDDDTAAVEMRDGSDALQSAATSTTAAAAEAEAGAAMAADAAEGETEESADDGGDTALLPPEEPAADEAAADTTEATIEAMEDDGSLDAANFWEENGPLEVETFDGITALDIFNTIEETPLLSVEEFECADQKVVRDLRAPSGQAPLLFDGEAATLVIFEGEPEAGSATPSVAAVVIDPDCEIILR